jgi:hypothetical protein
MRKKIVRDAASGRDDEVFSMFIGEGNEADRSEGRSKKTKRKNKKREENRTQD